MSTKLNIFRGQREIKMKKLVCLVVILAGAFTYSSVLATAYSSAAALVSSVGAFKVFAYFALCAICLSTMIVLRRKGCLPLGFFLIVLGGFFLGAASRSPALAAEINAGIGFTFFLVGYLIVHFESRRVSIEVTEPLTRAQRVAAIERLMEEDGISVAPGLAIVPELPVQESQLQLQESQSQLFA